MPWCVLYHPVLSDEGKRRVYDAGLLSLVADDEDEVSFIHAFIHFLTDYLIFILMVIGCCNCGKQGFCDFIQEMALMMESVNPQVYNNQQEMVFSC